MGIKKRKKMITYTNPPILKFEADKKDIKHISAKILAEILKGEQTEITINKDNTISAKLKHWHKPYNEKGELKPIYRNAIQILGDNQMKFDKINTEPQKEEDEYEKTLIETADQTTRNIKHILDDIIDNTGKIQSIKIRLDNNQTKPLLQTLTKHSQELTDTHLNWTIKEYCENDIELTLEQIIYYGEKD